jgi:hypothetical protein
MQRDYQIALAKGFWQYRRNYTNITSAIIHCLIVHEDGPSNEHPVRISTGLSSVLGLSIIFSSNWSQVSGCYSKIGQDYLRRILFQFVGRDSSVGIATRYGLDGPCFVFRWRRGFLHPSRPSLGRSEPPIKWVSGFFPGVKRPGSGVNHPPHLAPRLKKE